MGIPVRRLQRKKGSRDFNLNCGLSLVCCDGRSRHQIVLLLLGGRAGERFELRGPYLLSGCYGNHGNQLTICCIIMAAMPFSAPRIVSLCSRSARIFWFSVYFPRPIVKNSCLSLIRTYATPRK